MKQLTRQYQEAEDNLEDFRAKWHEVGPKLPAPPSPLLTDGEREAEEGPDEDTRVQSDAEGLATREESQAKLRRGELTQLNSSPQSTGPGAGVSLTH